MTDDTITAEEVGENDFYLQAKSELLDEIEAKGRQDQNDSEKHKRVILSGFQPY